MTLGECRQPPANRGAVTLGVYAWGPLKGVPTANRGAVTPSDTTPSVCQPWPSVGGVPEARRALSCAPALPQATPGPTVEERGIPAYDHSTGDRLMRTGRRARERWENGKNRPEPRPADTRNSEF